MIKEEKFKAYVAVYLALIKNKKVLLMKRANTGYHDGDYSLVAGHLDGGETAKQGMIRETEEEAGIILDTNNLEIIHILHRQGIGREHINIFLQTDTWKGKITNTEPEKCDGLKWFPLNKLPENIVPEVKAALTNIENKIFYGEFGWDK